ncbi:hypothetical protein bcgnr5372_26560 [Bacillus luti]|nr:hypothetical protein [Bacillus cereus]HDR8331363.1 hypothetical protein [Bacillus cereus]HDR8335949.1 hypothetical protein [Bacillus cereus]
MNWNDFPTTDPTEYDNRLKQIKTRINEQYDGDIHWLLQALELKESEYQATLEKVHSASKLARQYQEELNKPQQPES